MPFEWSEDQVKAKLKPYEGQFRSIMRRALARFMARPAEDRAIIAANPSASASLINRYMQHEASLEFNGSGEVTPHTKYHSTTYEIEQVEVRLKKLTSDGQSRNYPTKRALSFFGIGQFELFDSMWAAPVRVDLGYVLDALGHGFSDMMVACRWRGMTWAYSIMDSAVVIALPVSQTEPQVTPAKVVAKKSGAADEAATNLKSGADAS